MHKTLLLCFIHGFKGGDDTFGEFPEHLRALISHALPSISVKAVTYPKFDTRGDLKECVERFREWLQNKVIDLEVAASTPSPTIDPSVHTILIGHSMGGIVAAETLLIITSDSPVPSVLDTKSNPTDPISPTAEHTQRTTLKTAQTNTQKFSCPSTPLPQNISRPSTPQSDSSSFMFPYIQGVLAFDTPYLGISPGVVAHGAEQHYKNASTAYSAISEVVGVLGYGSSSNKNTPKSPQQQQVNQKLLTQGADAMSASMTNATGNAAAVPAWQKWGKYAMFAGAAGAVSAAAYLKRDTITEGWSFLGSHLEFVGCLAKGEELKSRLERIVKLNEARSIGFADLITVLGKGAPKQNKPGTAVAGGFVEIGAVEGIAPNDRTFCTIPKSEKNRKFFEKAKNDKASDEMQAHMNMFGASGNSGYFALCERAKVLVVDWMGPEKSAWYKESIPSKTTGPKGLADVDLGD
ncbi:MAG: hypothetical protein ALECFALPRED_008593 [Alectoria fallacina]|uniref:AB hydrolase-1 domain-containing protein n=1 Tax=Alectoria fallacina TaxID=1903189 RepID=A0A8H3I5X3_9LECA|nr:MAG: hypothetical protein ALECFALPRED_008593 [Alectoria fallacina]